MKKLFLSSLVLLFFSASMIVFQMSCKKSVAAQNTKTKTDTVYVYNCDTSSIEHQLTKKMWQVDYLTHLIGCTLSTFKKGGSNTTSIIMI